MTDFLLALVPDYGLYIVVAIVFVATLGIPLPSSVIALTSGGLAATGDLVLGEVLLATFCAYVIGDQLAFTLGSRVKPESLDRMRSSPRVGPMVHRSESFYCKHGLMAILLSRTLVSSIGPYIAYFSGALKTPRVRFSVMALTGAAIWTGVYVMLGYTFAGNLPQISDLVASFIMAGIAAVITIAFAVKLTMAWRRFEAEE